MRKLAVLISLLAAVGLTVVAAAALADRGHGNGNGKKFSAKLTGFEETPSESTPGRGSFKARLTNGGTVISYRLKYEDFEAAEGATLFAHIHFGQVGVAGGVSAFLCGGGDKPPCTPLEGDISGTIDAADVIGPGGQGIAAGEMAELIRAMKKGYTYANVHTTLNTPGLIRGQINRRGGRGHDD
jgi:CHRD domain